MNGDLIRGQSVWIVVGVPKEITFERNYSEIKILHKAFTIFIISEGVCK